MVRVTPQNMKGEEIFAEACIAAVSDVVGSMTSCRSSPGLEAALQEIRKKGESFPIRMSRTSV